MKIPATLDLCQNAALSLNFLQKNCDRDGLPYFYTFFNDPAEARHQFWDYGEIPGRYLYGFAFAKQILGLKKEFPAEKKIKKHLFRNFGQDGLNYYPAGKAFGIDLGLGHVAGLWENRSIFMGLFMSRLLSGDELAGKYARGIVERIKQIAIRKNNGECYFSEYFYPEGYKPDKRHKPYMGENIGGWITPLERYFNYTKDEAALETAIGLSNFLVNNIKIDQRLYWQGRFNTHSILFSLAGILRCAKHTHNKAHIQWVKKHFDWITSHAASSFGWVAEHPHRYKLRKNQTQSCEICAVVDAIDTAILLAKLGYPEYWNMAERYGRNYLAEAQLNDVSWIKSTITKKNTALSAFDNIPERIKGCFAGWGGVNDFINPDGRHGSATQNCCGPHGVLGTFLLWENILTKEQDNIYVNFALNRRSAWADVISYQPHAGKLSVIPRINANLFIRVPDWAQKDKIKVMLNDKNAKKAWKGPYLSIPGVNKESTLTVQYPLAQYCKSEKIEKKAYLTEWRGETAISIKPEGKICPLFKRETSSSDIKNIAKIPHAANTAGDRLQCEW